MIPPTAAPPPAVVKGHDRAATSPDVVKAPMTVTERLAKARAARRSGPQPSAKSVDGLLKQAGLDRRAAEIAQIAKRLEDVPETMRRTYLRAVSGKSKPAAIRAFCAECVAWEREEVRRCTAPACPLYPYRPFMGRKRP